MTSIKSNKHLNKKEATQKNSFFHPQNKSVDASPFFQPKLTITPTDDPSEKEADQVADKVIDQEESYTVQKKPLSNLPINRKCAHCEEEEKLQRKDDGSGNISADASSLVNDALQSSGTPLDNGTLSSMSQKIGYDFSPVRIHTGTMAAKSANSINAIAYTSGNNIVFNEGQYAPDTKQGKKLIAHELTHVVQQNQYPNLVQRKPDDLTDAIADILAPQRILAKGAISILELLPKDERDAAIKLMISKSIGILKTVREPPDMLKTAISSITPGLSPTTVWPILVSGLIGFYQHLDTLSGDELFTLMKKVINAQSDPMFYVGGIEGVVEGIFKWFKDIFDLIVLLAEIGGNMAFPPWFIYNHSDEIKKAWEIAVTAGKWISDNKDSLLELLKDKEAMMALQSVVKELIYSAAEGAGSQIAEAIIKTINEGPRAMGKAGGMVVGYIIPDIILAVGTDGISGVLKGAQGVFKTFRAATMSIEEALLAIKAVEKVIEGIKGLKIFAKGSKLGELGAKFTELLEQLIKIYKGFKNSHEDVVKKIIEIAKSKGMPLDAAADKMYNITNLKNGLLHTDFIKSKSFKEAINILLDGSHADWKKVYQSITYAAQKGRFAEFDIIFEAIVKGKVLAIPRGFASLEEFVEFSKDIRGMVSRFGKDVRVQGSSTMNLSSALKDIDIAIFADEAEFISSMKKVWGKQFAEYYKLTAVPEAIDTKTFLQFLAEAEKTGKGGIAANGVKITGEMESAWLARKNGKIFGSKLLTNAEKKLRDAWVLKLKLEKLDISLIMRGKAFDVGPFIPLK